MSAAPIAIIADAHLHDTEADFGLAGVVAGGRRRVLRPWPLVSAAARGVNESLFAFRAALSVARARGVREVVLLGDVTDDGQRATAARIAALLAAEDGLRFHILPGNHDGWGTHGKHSDAAWMGPAGPVAVTSDPKVAARQPGAVLTDAVRIESAGAVLEALAGAGLTRRPGDRRWETAAGDAASPATTPMPMSAADGSVTHALPDTSRLIEPEPGLWLMLLDANLFRPRPGAADPSRKAAFLDPATAGWSALPEAKPWLLDWACGVARRAAAAGARLVALSHYPLADPFPDDAALIPADRRPDGRAAARLAAAGVSLHLAGHLHAAAVTPAPGGLTEVAVPSPCAWPPGFALLHPVGPAVEWVSLAALPLPGWLRDFYAAGGAAPVPATLGALTRGQALARLGDPARVDRWAGPLA
jgi:3',5'-cyclic AMP phosphodiesterase CpdA